MINIHISPSTSLQKSTSYQVNLSVIQLLKFDFLESSLIFLTLVCLDSSLSLSCFRIIHTFIKIYLEQVDFYWKHTEIFQIYTLILRKYCLRTQVYTGISLEKMEIFAVFKHLPVTVDQVLSKKKNKYKLRKCLYG